MCWAAHFGTDRRCRIACGEGRFQSRSARQHTFDLKYALQRGRLKYMSGSREKRLDKKWHPVENHSRAVSAFPLNVVVRSSPFASPE